MNFYFEESVREILRKGTGWIRLISLNETLTVSGFWALTNAIGSRTLSELPPMSKFYREGTLITRVGFTR